MAVKNFIASGALDPSNPKQQPLPAEVVDGKVKPLISTQEIVACDATSTVKFGAIPSNARILVQSVVGYDAITGATDFDLGIGKTDGGVLTVKDADCLIDGADIHTAGSKAIGVDLASLGKAAWELAGYTADPGGNVDIVGTFNQAPTAGGTLTLSLLYTTP
jgi:hypothetical protein